MVKKVPQLSVRPVLLDHTKDLIRSNCEFKYSFELYEDMVDAWLNREEGVMMDVKKEPLRQLSELLAIELFVIRIHRGAERLPKNELTVMAKEWNIPLDDWQLTTRSLLNRDAFGNYKFAHRSIMESLIVKRFLDTPPAKRPKTSWTDQIYQFLEEIIRDQWEKIIDSLI